MGGGAEAPPCFQLGGRCESGPVQGPASLETRDEIVRFLTEAGPVTGPASEGAEHSTGADALQREVDMTSFVGPAGPTPFEGDVYLDTVVRPTLRFLFKGRMRTVYTDRVRVMLLAQQVRHDDLHKVQTAIDAGELYAIRVNDYEVHLSPKLRGGSDQGAGEGAVPEERKVADEKAKLSGFGTPFGVIDEAGGLDGLAVALGALAAAGSSARRGFDGAAVVAETGCARTWSQFQMRGAGGDLHAHHSHWVPVDASIPEGPAVKATGLLTSADTVVAGGSVSDVSSALRSRLVLASGDDALQVASATSARYTRSLGTSAASILYKLLDFTRAVNKLDLGALRCLTGCTAHDANGATHSRVAAGATVYGLFPGQNSRFDVPGDVDLDMSLVVPVPPPAIQAIALSLHDFIRWAYQGLQQPAWDPAGIGNTIAVVPMTSDMMADGASNFWWTLMHMAYPWVQPKHTVIQRGVGADVNFAGMELDSVIGYIGGATRRVVFVICDIFTPVVARVLLTTPAGVTVEVEHLEADVGGVYDWFRQGDLTAINTRYSQLVARWSRVYGSRSDEQLAYAAAAETAAMYELPILSANNANGQWNGNLAANFNASWLTPGDPFQVVLDAMGLPHSTQAAMDVSWENHTTPHYVFTMRVAGGNRTVIPDPHAVPIVPVARNWRYSGLVTGAVKLPRWDPLIAVSIVGKLLRYDDTSGGSMVPSSALELSAMLLRDNRKLAANVDRSITSLGLPSGLLYNPHRTSGVRTVAARKMRELVAGLPEAAGVKLSIRLGERPSNAVHAYWHVMDVVSTSRLSAYAVAVALGDATLVGTTTLIEMPKSVRSLQRTRDVQRWYECVEPSELSKVWMSIMMNDSLVGGADAGSQTALLRLISIWGDSGYGPWNFETSHASLEGARALYVRVGRADFIAGRAVSASSWHYSMALTGPVRMILRGPVVEKALYGFPGRTFLGKWYLDNQTTIFSLGTVPGADMGASSTELGEDALAGMFRVA